MERKPSQLSWGERLTLSHRIASRFLEHYGVAFIYAMLPAIAALGAALVSDEVLATIGAGPKSQHWIRVIAVLAIFVGTIGFALHLAIFYLPRQESLHQIKEERTVAVQLNEAYALQLANTMTSARELIDDFLKQFACDFLLFSDNAKLADRLSLYLIEYEQIENSDGLEPVLRKPKTELRRLSRYSQNTRYRYSGRKLYSASSGIIDRALQQGQAIEEVLPDPESDLEAYIERQQQLGVPRDVVTGFIMRPRFYYAVALWNVARTERVAVLVVESETPSRWKEQDLPASMAGGVEFMTRLLHHTMPLIPKLATAQMRGF